MVGVEVRGLNACPCAQGLVRERARERLADSGYDGAQIDEIFSLLPAATHNQRAEATLMIGTNREIDARDMIGIAESSMSAPVFELLKRPDELFVVEHAHLHPRFVEDSVRLMIAGTLETYPDLSDGVLPPGPQVNHETIHNHDVWPERHGVVSELRADLDGSPGAAAPSHHRPGSGSGVVADRVRGIVRDNAAELGAAREDGAQVDAVLGPGTEAGDVGAMAPDHPCASPRRCRCRRPTAGPRRWSPPGRRRRHDGHRSRRSGSRARPSAQRMNAATPIQGTSASIVPRAGCDPLPTPEAEEERVHVAVTAAAAASTGTSRCSREPGR
jgi:hypothetical protein